jgi:hypothetical protein
MKVMSTKTARNVAVYVICQSLVDHSLSNKFLLYPGKVQFSSALGDRRPSGLGLNSRAELHSRRTMRSASTAKIFNRKNVGGCARIAVDLGLHRTTEISILLRP